MRLINGLIRRRAREREMCDENTYSSRLFIQGYNERGYNFSFDSEVKVILSRKET